MELFTIFLVLCIATSGYTKSFNVIDYGAVGDGNADDAEAFTKAWEAVCGDKSGDSTLNIPQGKTFLLKPLQFIGPCISPGLHVQVDGNIVASSNLADYNEQNHWIAFQNVNGLVVNGTGQIDGQGSPWWKACPLEGDNCTRPTALGFYNGNNIQVSGLKHINSAKNHISISNCDNVNLTGLHITAPEDSPNTDGIDISHSTNIQVLNSYIGTGDDCIAINTGCSNIRIQWLTCGPGHGISVGSLGNNGENAAVEGIHVENCTLNATQNGARIKTWQGGSGYARNITFMNIILIAADNPILINQFYCPHETCSNQESAVNISDVSFIGVHGTTIQEEAININCSQSIGCTDIVLNHITITPTPTDSNMLVYSSCNNAHGTWNDSTPKVDCLSP